MQKALILNFRRLFSRLVKSTSTFNLVSPKACMGTGTGNDNENGSMVEICGKYPVLKSPNTLQVSKENVKLLTENIV